MPMMYRLPVQRPLVGLTVAASLLGLTFPAGLTAQQPPSGATQQGHPVPVDSASRTGQTVRLRSPIVTGGDYFIAAALATTAALLIPADASIAREFQRSGPQSSSAIRGTAEGLEAIGSSGAVIFGGSLYVAGLVSRKRGVADMGWHTLEAIAISTQATTALKGLFGRTRPYAASGDAQDFDLGGGFGESTRRSFPSGHTSMAFTFASVLAGETAHRWPRAHKYLAPLAYAAATGVGLARMYNDKHWASDVALGAAIGTLSGRIVVRYGHGRPNNWIDRIGLALVPAR